MFRGGLLMTMLPSKTTTAAEAKKKTVLSLAPGLDHFPVSPGGSKTDDPIGAGVGPSPPKKEALSSLHIAAVG